MWCAERGINANFQLGQCLGATVKAATNLDPGKRSPACPEGRGKDQPRQGRRAPMRSNRYGKLLLLRLLLLKLQGEKDVLKSASDSNRTGPIFASC